MRLAKATGKDIEKTKDFLQFMERLFDSRQFRNCEGDWESQFGKETDEYKMFKSIQKDLSFEEGCEPEKVDDRLVVYEAIVRMYKRCDLHWNRVVWAADILIDNCCDPCKNYLDWHPYIERAMDNGYFGE